MSLRRCSQCNTPLRGKRGHGFVNERGVVCGRSKVQKAVGRGDEAALIEVETPRCRR